MFKMINKKSLQISAAFTVGMLAQLENAHAGGAGGGGTTSNDFSSIAENIITSIQSLPGLLTGIAYMMGILFGVLGILKIKDHVENPTNTKLQEGAVRLAAGGGLFALPIIYEAMLNTIGQGSGVAAAELTKVEFAVN